jgi:hypothetical protein
LSSNPSTVNEKTGFGFGTEGVTGGGVGATATT